MQRTVGFNPWTIFAAASVSRPGDGAPYTILAVVTGTQTRELRSLSGKSGPIVAQRSPFPR